MFAYTATPTPAQEAARTELARVNALIAAGSDPLTIAHDAGYAAYLADAPTAAPMWHPTMHALLAPLGTGKAAHGAAMSMLRAYGRGWDRAAIDTFDDYATAVANGETIDAAEFKARLTHHAATTTTVGVIQ